MSLYGSLRTGVSGLSANSQRIAMISDNIANLNTFGYKRVDAQFSTFLTNSLGSSVYSSGGVETNSIRDISEQGSIEISNHSTDFAISGKGYFVVTDSLQADANGNFNATGRISYTRSGQFRVDANGNLRNSDGYYLLAWPRNQANTDFIQGGDITGFTPVNVANQNFEPIATTQFNLGVNLTTTTGVGPDSAYTITQSVFDPQGTQRDLDIAFERQSTLGARKDLTFSDGTQIFTLAFNTPQEEHWRAYVSVENASIVGYNSQGAATGASTERVPIADILFGDDGSLDTILLPGMLETFAHSKFPLSNGLVNEAGATTANPINLTTLNNAELRGIAGVIQRYMPATNFTIPNPTIAEISAGLISLDLNAEPEAMLEIYHEMTSQTIANDPNRAAAGIPSGFFGSVGDLQIFNVLPGASFGTPTLGNLTGDFAGGRIVSNAGGVRVDGNGIVKYARDGQDKIRINIDYNNNINSVADQVAFDLDLGSLNFNAFARGGSLNNGFTPFAFSNIGTGEDGLTNYFDEISTVRRVEQNGRQFSSLQSVSVDQYGVIAGSYDNGENRDLYKVPLAVFANPNGLVASSGNVYTQSQDSGDAIIREASSTSAGSIRGASLEASSVDVAREFSNMIITQRGYSASTKVITAADEMLRELASIR